MDTSEKRYLERRARTHRLTNVLIILPAVIGILLIIFASLAPSMRYYYEPVVIPLIFASLALSAMIFLMRYLQTGVIFREPPPIVASSDSGFPSSFQMQQTVRNQQDRIEQLQESLSDIQDKIGNLSAIDQLQLNSDQQQKLVDAVKHRIEASASEEFLQNLKEQAALSFQQSEKIDLIDQSRSRTFERLNREIAALGRRGNINLSIGVVATIFGLGVLYAYVSTIAVDANNPWMAAGINFIPRLSLVVFIELFGYFFLKLYKSSLSEIKYFQNELTNVEAKYVSLRAALLNKDNNTVSEVVKALSKTERNFLLEKGQSTVDLEQRKIDSAADSSVIKSVSQMLKSFKTMGR